MKIKEFFENLLIKFFDRVFDCLGIHGCEEWEDTYLMNECIRYPYYVDGVPPEYALLTCYPDPVWGGDWDFPLVVWEVLETLLAGKCAVVRLSSWAPKGVEFVKDELSHIESVYLTGEEIYVVSNGMNPALGDVIAARAGEFDLIWEVFGGCSFVGGNFEDAEEAYTIGAKVFLDLSFGEHCGAQFVFSDPADRETARSVLAEVCRKYGKKLIESNER